MTKGKTLLEVVIDDPDYIEWSVKEIDSFVLDPDAVFEIRKNYPDFLAGDLLQENLETKYIAMLSEEKELADYKNEILSNMERYFNNQHHEIPRQEYKYSMKSIFMGDFTVFLN